MTSLKLFVLLFAIGVGQVPAQVSASVSALRRLKHLCDLMSLLQQGHSAEIIFVIQRTDCDSFAPAAEIDPPLVGRGQPQRSGGDPAGSGSWR